MRILCIKLEINQGYTTMHGQPVLKITLHVSDGLSVHHQEFKTVHTALGICHTGSLTAC